MLDYEIILKKSDSSIKSIVQNVETELDLTVKLNDVGALSILLPCCPDYCFDDFQIDERLEICCSCNCGDSFLLADTPWLISRKEYCENANGECAIKLTCVSANDILARRLVAYTTESSQGKSTNENAVDLLYRIWAQNGGDPAQTGNFNQATDASRDLSSCVSTCPHTAGSVTAPAVTLTFGGQTLLAAMQSVVDAANAKDGTEIFFGITQKECCTGQLEFCVSVGQPGVKRDITISNMNETLGDFCLSKDQRGSANRVYSTDGNQKVTVVDDPNLAAITSADCLALREVTTSTTGTDTNSGLDAGNSELKRLGKTESISGTLSSLGNLDMGCDWNYGDRVNVTVVVCDQAYTYSTVINSLNFNQKAGVQTISSSLSQAGSGVSGATGVAGLVAQVKDLQRQVAKLVPKP